MKLDVDSELDSEPLLGPEGACGHRDEAMLYDEDGSLTLALAALDKRAGDTPSTPCPVGRLNGSWFIHITPQDTHTTTVIRGAMRIEVAAPRIRISGDIYVANSSLSPEVVPLAPITPSPLIIKRNWYPQFDHKQYAWYFRSLGVQYQAGVLTFKFERHLWNPMTQEFGAVDNGFMKLVCGQPFTHASLPQPTIQMTGTAEIGGETHTVVARKTSTLQRGCDVEVDVMKNRSFPVTAETCAGAAITFTSIYRTAGWDCRTRISQTDVPDDDELTTMELQAALSAFRDPATHEGWRLWLLVGSAQGGLFGIMFDDTPPHREGAAGFFDSTIPDQPVIQVSARNKKIGEVPSAFLRTLVHEAGHAFNLFHPKHDAHTVPIGTTIMNQTGDVLGFATPGNQYPCNVTFGFDDHNRTSLLHSPDPQVAPGRKAFGWGHGDLSSGVAVPVDATGLVQLNRPATGLTLTVHIKDTIFRGEFVSARFVVTNDSTGTKRITSALNLSQGDLRLRVTPPNRAPMDVRDRILACGDRRLVDLAPGASLESVAQIFYTTAGRTFRQTGRYYVSAELDTGDGMLESEPVDVVVRAPLTEEERAISQIMMDEEVARSLALGDFGLNEAAKAKLEDLVARFGPTATGAAGALVLANSYARPMRNLRTGRVVRRAEPERARRAMSVAVKGRGPTELVDLAIAVVAPTDGDAPILGQVAGEPARARKGARRGGKAAAPRASATGPGARLAVLRRALVR
jgi:hypothetical protein